MGPNTAVTIYAVSIPGVMPSANITWFQAAEAWANFCDRQTEVVLRPADWKVSLLRCAPAFPGHGAPSGLPLLPKTHQPVKLPSRQLPPPSLPEIRTCVCRIRFDQIA